MFDAFFSARWLMSRTLQRGASGAFPYIAGTRERERPKGDGLCNGTENRLQIDGTLLFSIWFAGIMLGLTSAMFL